MLRRPPRSSRKESSAASDVYNRQVVDDLEETDHLEKCTKQHVETVAMNVKYHLSQEILDQFIVQTALKTISEINSEYKKIKIEYNYLPL